jgi:peptidoglycan/LPS O-acetylase OafA/YrhL
VSDVKDTLQGVRETAPTKRIHIVEALRGFAAVGVTLFHFCNQLSSDPARVIADYGWLGVDVFFVISGFVIPLSLFGRGYRLRDFPTFILRRLVRLEPPYLASIALILVLWKASSLSPLFQGSAPSYTSAQIASHLFYLIPLTNYNWLSPVYWSLAYEFVFYIIVGLTFVCLMRRPIEITVALGALAVGISFFIYSAVDVRILEFLIGSLSMRVTVNDERKMAATLWLSASLLVAFGFGGLAVGISVTIATLGILFLRDVVCGRWALFLGEISYSLYLIHVPVGGRVINLGRRFGDGTIYEIFLVTTALFVSLLVALFWSRAIENWATRASRKIGERQARAVVGP